MRTLTGKFGFCVVLALAISGGLLTGRGAAYSDPPPDVCQADMSPCDLPLTNCCCKGAAIWTCSQNFDDCRSFCWPYEPYSWIVK